MEFLAQVFEVILWAVFLYWLVKRVSGWLSGRSGRPPEVHRQPPAPTKTLHRDPVCGTYVSEDISRRLDEGGTTLHFCSDQCRMRYLARQNRSARA